MSSIHYQHHLNQHYQHAQTMWTNSQIRMKESQQQMDMSRRTYNSFVNRIHHVPIGNFPHVGEWQEEDQDQSVCVLNLVCLFCYGILAYPLISTLNDCEPVDPGPYQYSELQATQKGLLFSYGAFLVIFGVASLFLAYQVRDRDALKTKVSLFAFSFFSSLSLVISGSCALKVSEPVGMCFLVSGGLLATTSFFGSLLSAKEPLKKGWERLSGLRNRVPPLENDRLIPPDQETWTSLS